MARQERVKPDCIDGRCGHPARAHDDINGLCWGRILTVHDTDENCPCMTYLIDEPQAACRRCGGDPYSCPCTTGWDSIRGMIW